jgi:hypothetical protein
MLKPYQDYGQCETILKRRGCLMGCLSFLAGGSAVPLPQPTELALSRCTLAPKMQILGAAVVQ